MRARVVLLAIALASLVTGGVAATEAVARVTGKPPDLASAARAVSQTSLLGAQAATPPPLLLAGPVTVNHNGFWSWALLDRKSGELAGSPNMATQTNSTESMIKIWIVSDFLRRTAEKGQTPTQARLTQASTAIRNSNDNSAQALYVVGGGNAVVTRLISTCGLTETKLYAGWWSRTQMSARDAVRMGLCVADGRAAGPTWTRWVLDEMRHVQGGVKDQPPGFGPTGGGHWGIIDGLPADITPDVSIKNGWTPIYADGLWHVNCLAVHEEFILAVQVRYPISQGLQFGADVCKSVTQQLVHNAETG